AGFTPVDVDLRVGDGLPQRVAGEMVSANYFDVLRAPPVAGRSFSADEESQAASNIVVSWTLAASLSSDPMKAAGTTLRINGTTVRVIGVMADGFRGAELPGKPLLWFPLGAARVLDPTTPAAPAPAVDRT